MLAHRQRAHVSRDHTVTLELPDEFVGEVEVLVLLNPSSTSRAGRKKLSVDEFLAGRRQRPAGVGPVSLEEMERAIAQGASGRGSV